MSNLNRRGILVLTASGGILSLGSEVQARTGKRPALTRPVEEGPFYLPDAPVRADISEGLPGVPVDLHFQILDETGAPLQGARVDAWHCDAQGKYSGFGDAPGETADAKMTAARFFRGVQPTDKGGRAMFHTVYPGWYMGRTTHVHYKVWWNRVAVLTSQGFLPDALNEFLYTQAPDYRRDQTRDTLNSNDRVAHQAGELGLGAIKDAGDRYVVTHTVVVDRAARPTRNHGPGEWSKLPSSGPLPDGMRGPPPGFAGEGGRLPFGPPPGGPPNGRRSPVLTGEARLSALLPGAKREA